MKRILVIEDDFDIQKLLETHLVNEGYNVELASDGLAGFELFTKNDYDLILLDLLLPKLDGYGVCELIRKTSNIPIIMLTALDNEDSQIKGLDLQADDYITKPFSFAILKLKISNLFKRTQNNPENKKIVYGSITLDLEGYKVFLDGVDCELTPREFELLRELLLNKNKVFTRQMLLDNVWGYDYFGNDRIVDTHIKNIRKRVNADIIKTIKGVGYRIDG